MSAWRVWLLVRGHDGEGRWQKLSRWHQTPKQAIAAGRDVTEAANAAHPGDADAGHVLEFKVMQCR